MTVPYIAISGKICSGKSELARRLSQELGIPVRPIAGALKEMVHNALIQSAFCPPEVLTQRLNYIEWFEANKTIMRPIYQAWGMAFREAHGEKFWINHLMHIYYKQGPFIVDDLRFRSEMAVLKEHNFKTVRLEFAHMVTQLERVNKLYPDTDVSNLRHISETDLDKNTDFDLQFWSETPPEELVSVVMSNII